MNLSTTEIGNVSEQVVLELLLSLDCIQWAQRDFNGSKYDIFFTLKSDGLMRGLQVKTLGVVINRKNQFQIKLLNKYF